MTTVDHSVPAASDPPLTALAASSRSERLVRHAPLALGLVVFIAVAVYGSRQLLGEWGLALFGATDAGRDTPLRLDRMAGVAPPAPGTPAAPPRAVDPASITLRDLPPRPPARDLPRFTLRDGEVDDVLTDLDAETMQRLGAVQGQLDGVLARAESLHQTMRALTQQASQQYQHIAAQQRQTAQDVTAARQEIATLTLAVADVEARLKRAAPLAGGAAATAQGIPGWRVTAISGDRAWLRTPKGDAVTVTVGERLQALGTIQAVDPLRKRVVLSDGRVVR